MPFCSVHSSLCLPVSISLAYCGCECQSLGLDRLVSNEGRNLNEAICIDSAQASMLTSQSTRTLHSVQVRGRLAAIHGRPVQAHGGSPVSWRVLETS